MERKPQKKKNLSEFHSQHVETEVTVVNKRAKAFRGEVRNGEVRNNDKVRNGEVRNNDKVRNDEEQTSFPGNDEEQKSHPRDDRDLHQFTDPHKEDTNRTLDTNRALDTRTLDANRAQTNKTEKNERHAERYREIETPKRETLLLSPSALIQIGASPFSKRYGIYHRIFESSGPKEYKSSRQLKFT